MVSIAFFNFAGVSVTKELSATTRMVLDSVRTLVIWAVSLALRWQNFYWPQVRLPSFAVFSTGFHGCLLSFTEFSWGPCIVYLVLPSFPGVLGSFT